MPKNAREKNDLDKEPFLKWYLVATKPKQEFRALENLENQAIKVFMPQIKVEKLVRGRRKIVHEPMFKGYLFIYLSPENPSWHRVRSTRGVKDWVRFSGKPATLPDELVSTFRVVEEKASNDIKQLFVPGCSVKINAGPFKGLNGIFQAADGELRSMILIEFLGKSSCLSLENVQISIE